MPHGTSDQFNPIFKALIALRGQELIALNLTRYTENPFSFLLTRKMTLSTCVQFCFVLYLNLFFSQRWQCEMCDSFRMLSHLSCWIQQNPDAFFLFGAVLLDWCESHQSHFGISQTTGSGRPEKSSISLTLFVCGVMEKETNSSVVQEHCYNHY